MNALGRCGAFVLGALACGWVGVARVRHRGRARRLDPGEIAALRGCFSEAMLRPIRVAEVERVALPGARLTGWALRRIGAADSVLESPAGIALGNLVIVSRGAGGRGRWMSVLFHELVHAAQYRGLGTRRFLSRYMGAWAIDKCAYLDIPLEVQAYEMQERFDRGEVVDVEAEVAEWKGRRRY